VWLEALWNAYTQDVTRARSMPSNALNQYIAEEPAALAAVNGDAAKLALQRGLVTALKSRRQVADDLKGLVGEDQDNHSFNAIGMSQYLAAARSKRVLKSKSDARVGIVRGLQGKSRRSSTAGHHRRREHGRSACVRRATTPRSRRWCSGSTARAAACSRRNKFCARLQALRKAGQTCRGLDEHLRGVGRLLYFRRGQSDFSRVRRRSPVRSGVFSVVPTFQHTLEKLGVKVDGIGTTPLAGDMRMERTLGPAARQILADFRGTRVCGIPDACGRRTQEERGPRWTRSRKAACGRAWMRSASV